MTVTALGTPDPPPEPPRPPRREPLVEVLFVAGPLRGKIAKMSQHEAARGYLVVPEAIPKTLESLVDAGLIRSWDLGFREVQYDIRNDRVAGWIAVPT